MKPMKLVAGVFLLAAIASAAPSGEEVYKTRCAACHDQSTPRIPPRDALRQLHATRILRTLDFGLMMNVAYTMKRDEREAVANFLGLPRRGNAGGGQHLRERETSAGGPVARQLEWLEPVARQHALSADRRAPASRIDQMRELKLKWAFGFAGDIIAFAAPTVVNGTVFVGSASGAIQALDAKTGCTHWVFQANGPVRMALLAVPDGAKTSLVFADQIGWVYSLDASTGKQLWRRRIEDHEATRLTGSPVADAGVVYIPAASWEETRSLDPQYACCTFRGSLTALRVSDGSRSGKLS